MNKVVNINLNGIIISIDEIAYDKLKQYIDALHKHFNGTEGAAEIISDIESRVAELLQMKLNESYTVIQEHDVKDVIGIMGNPWEMEAESVDGESADHQNFGEKRAEEPKKLRRDTRNKVISGVCSGIGNYLNIDTVFIRAIFLIAFFVFGSGIFLYLLLWIAMPEAAPGELPKPGEHSGRRLFRSEEDKMLGGVCAGAGNYFGIDPVWIRFLFLIAFFFYGSGLLLYIILWAVVPKAVSAAQKLQMKGEPVDVNNIERVIRETFGNKNTGEAGQGLLQNLISMMAHLIKFVLKLTAKILGVIAFLMAIGLLIFGVVMIVYQQDDFYDLVRTILVNEQIMQMACWGVMCLLASIIIGLLTFAISLLFSLQVKLRYVGLVSTVLCVAGIVLSSAAAIKYSLTVKNKQHVTERTFVHPVADTLYFNAAASDTGVNSISIRVHDNDVEFFDGERFEDDISFVFMTAGKHALVNMQEITLKPSLTDSVEIRVKKHARGKDAPEAKKISGAMHYGINTSANVFEFDRGIVLDTQFGYRFQRAEVLLSIPVGRVIVISKPVLNMIRGIDDDMESGTLFKMTQDGLVCVDCKNNSKNDHDEYEDDANESVSIDVDASDDDDRVKIEIRTNDSSARGVVKTEKKIGPVTIKKTETGKTGR